VQLLAHNLAKQMIARHRLRVVTQWSERRTDWLLGTTLNAPSAVHYEIDGISVDRIALSTNTRRQLAPWVWSYFLIQKFALPRITQALADQIEVFANEAEVIHNTRVGREGLSYASFQLARKHSLPFIFTPVHHPRWNGWLHRYYHHLYRQADAVIALTDAEKQTMIELGVKEDRVFVTGMGPDLAESHNAQRFRDYYYLGDAPLILFVGQKYPYKGVAALRSAATIVWKRFTEARFVFIGARTPHSRQLFSRDSDSRLIELDTVDLQTKTDAFAACDIFCLPSSQESFGGVFTEAWSFRKPVIGCGIPATRSVIDENTDGFLISQRSGEIAERIIYLLDHPGERKRLGDNGKRKVEERYTWKRLAAQTEEVYRQVLK
jgi:glycosyltransferase involved in cell wall biosynthesis